MDSTTIHCCYYHLKLFLFLCLFLQQLLLIEIDAVMILNEFQSWVYNCFVGYQTVVLLVSSMNQVLLLELLDHKLPTRFRVDIDWKLCMQLLANARLTETQAEHGESK